VPLHSDDHADFLPSPVANILKDSVVGRIDHRYCVFVLLK
jgi:hypothetical protein